LSHATDILICDLSPPAKWMCRTAANQMFYLQCPAAL